MQTAPSRAPVPRARQSYLFEQAAARGAYPLSPRFPVDASDDRSTPDEEPPPGPELDPEALCCDPTDPDSWASDPVTWPAWTDLVPYALTRRPGGGEP
jgi:hypothetical protein